MCNKKKKNEEEKIDVETGISFNWGPHTVGGYTAVLSIHNTMITILS